jgi:transcriptional regulator with XRE-family HTH domain
MSTLGERLKTVRKREGLSQGGIAKRLGIPQTTWSHYETGRNQPKRDLIEKICAEFSLDMEWLVFNRRPNLPAPKQATDSYPRFLEQSEKLMKIQDKLILAQERENALLKEVSALQAENAALRKELEAAQADAAKKGSALPAHASGDADGADITSDGARKAG